MSSKVWFISGASRGISDSMTNPGGIDEEHQQFCKQLDVRVKLVFVA